MSDKRFVLKTIGKLTIFIFLLYLIVIGQKNGGPVSWIAEKFAIESIRTVGLCVMILGVAGLLLQLYGYNRKNQ